MKSNNRTYCACEKVQLDTKLKKNRSKSKDLPQVLRSRSVGAYKEVNIRINVGPIAVRRNFNNAGFDGRMPREKPLHEENHKQGRLNSAKGILKSQKRSGKGFYGRMSPD